MHKLIVVGTGIKSISHLTEETKRIIQNADKVLYLVNEDNIKQWIQREAKQAESMDPIYFSSDQRVEAYQALTNHIVDEYLKVSVLCVVFYGHPTVFADSALNAVRQINQDGGDAIILPAVSAHDCLFSDLKIDPGSQGCFSIEATELFIFDRHIDVHSHLILWQAANFGRTDGQLTDNLTLLNEYLCRFYPTQHLICLYEAAPLPTMVPRIEWIPLSEFDKSTLNMTTTVYLPPLSQKSINIESLNKLGLSLDNLN